MRRELVRKKAAAVFPNEAPEDVMEVLDLYLGGEPERVQLGILKLAAGEFESLIDWIDIARRDYRDVLAAAEYPEQFKVAPEEWRSMEPAARWDIARRDREQYEAWLRGK